MGPWEMCFEREEQGLLYANRLAGGILPLQALCTTTFLDGSHIEISDRSDDEDLRGR